MDDVFIQAGAASLIVKVAVDIVKLARPAAPGWLYVFIACLSSPACLLALMAIGLPPGGVIVFDQPTLGVIFIGSILAAGTAVGVTELGKMAAAKRADATTPTP